MEDLNSNNEVYNNLLRTSDSFYGTLVGIQAYNNSTNANLWNNIVLGGGANVYGYINMLQTFATGMLNFMDYNVYDGTPVYSFGYYSSNPVTDTLAQVQAQGFEQHSHQVASATTIYQDTTSWVLKSAYTTAGRYGDPVGPRFPTAQILNTNRYGPGALN